MQGVFSIKFYFRPNVLKQVLYISYDGLTDPLGQSQILPYVVGLSKEGYQFTLISCEKADKIALGRPIIDAICKENNIDWRPLEYHKKPPIFSTIRDARSIRKLAFQLHRKKDFSIVHCRSHISSLVGLELKRKFGIPFIFDMRGFFADERVDGGLWNRSNPIYNLVYNFLKSKEAAYVQFSDAVISLTEAGKQIMLSWPTMQHSQKIIVIPCSVDMNLFDRSKLDPLKLNELKKGIDSDMTIGYYGSLGTWYMLNEMLEQFSFILAKYPKAKLLIVTKDKWEDEHIRFAKKNNIQDNQIIIRSAERNEMSYYMAITHVGLFFIKACFSKLASSPTKHGEMMSLGLPLIASAGVGDVDHIVEVSKSGYIISGFDKENYERATENISRLLKLDPNAIRNSCKEIYSLDSAIEKYLNVYNRISK